MKIYADIPSRRARQIAGDVWLVAWTAAWIWIAMRLHELIMNLAAPGLAVASGATDLAGSITSAGESVSGVPLVGDTLAAPFAGMGDAATSIAAAGQAEADAVATLATFASVALAVLAFASFAVFWVPIRLAFSPEGDRGAAIRRCQRGPRPVRPPRPGPAAPARPRPDRATIRPAPAQERPGDHPLAGRPRTPRGGAPPASSHLNAAVGVAPGRSCDANCSISARRFHSARSIAYSTSPNSSPGMGWGQSAVNLRTSRSPAFSMTRREAVCTAIVSASTHVTSGRPNAIPRSAIEPSVA